MTRRRTINGVLHNFLGTYASRYSDYDGYWLFGILVREIDDLKIDLLNPGAGNTDSKPLKVAVRLACQKFSEQMGKAGLDVSWVREAQLEITKLPELRHGAVNGRVRAGHNVRFMATVTSAVGKKSVRDITLFITKHDPLVEQRSSRAT